MNKQNRNLLIGGLAGLGALYYFSSSKEEQAEIATVGGGGGRPSSPINISLPSIDNPFGSGDSFSTFDDSGVVSPTDSSGSKKGVEASTPEGQNVLNAYRTSRGGSGGDSASMGDAVIADTIGPAGFGSSQVLSRAKDLASANPDSDSFVGPRRPSSSDIMSSKKDTETDDSKSVSGVTGWVI